MIPIVQTTFKDMQPSEAIEALVRKEAAKLERFFDGITSCRVVIEKPHRHHIKGAPYQVRIVLGVPGEEIVVKNAPSEHATLARAEAQRVRKSDELDAAHKDPQIAVQDAFRRVARRLQDYVMHLSGEVKVHEAVPTAQVTTLRPEFGFLRTGDGREIYFHRNSVLNDGFKRLQVGSTVRFVEEVGEKGAQASSVTLVGPAEARQLQT